MSKKKTELSFTFFKYLRQFYIDNKGSIKTYYRGISKKFLDYNNPENVNSFLWDPQFEALEMYIFLKEFLNNEPLHKVFDDWYNERGKFEGRMTKALTGEQLQFNYDGKVGSLDKEEYKEIFNEMKNYYQELYPNYIFALTMGTGKTILMATCIFYEFILANKFPKDEKYLHNALVFAPDKTVLESLREIKTFEKDKVVPSEYINWLDSNIKFHFLDDTDISLNILDNSKYNIIISNTQKIILKRRHKKKTPTETLFDKTNPIYDEGSVYDKNKDLYNFDSNLSERKFNINQRFMKIMRLKQLGIYVDEAHHLFGKNLTRDLGYRKKDLKTSLRITINKLAENLDEVDSNLVGCYNFTGTPYINNKILPDVVYAYGLKEAIDSGYLKEVTINGYSNTRNSEFLKIAINDFWEKYGKSGSRHEGMLPKMAIFGSTIKEVRNEILPEVEKILGELNISQDKILVNVGDTDLTTNDDIREFNNLDTPKSNKQFVILINKGREGWDCRSLFSVALYREPDSKVFVLQSTMRALRKIGDVQKTANIYLSQKNYEILENELKKNFRLGIGDLQKKSDKKTYKVFVERPNEKIKIMRQKRLYKLKEKDEAEVISFNFNNIDLEKYKLIHTKQDGLEFDDRTKVSKEINGFKEKREYSKFTLVAEIATYLNYSCIKIEEILNKSEESWNEILEFVNQYNEIIYDHIVPILVDNLYEIESYEHEEKEEIKLIKDPEEGYYEVKALPDYVIDKDDDIARNHKSKSFHLNPYCFDSKSEKQLFWSVLGQGKIKKIFFTGMLTHHQSDFYIQYIDPESNALRSYYPDFLVETEDGTQIIVEVKADYMVEDPVVEAKSEYAKQLASASSMRYEIVKSSKADKGFIDFISD
ncbi:type III restriction/modification enzyme restriction subunit [Halanaerobium saccharolyticum]|uniref:Type III restriction/modification enzyme restriction subunit n=1 Tax=Halanaerobium saccharolyticum TaxID=43595 RepID=A0A2T5RFP8_9FIRM|nr:TnsA endonuclease N-terminal domain-containing protein [Halanaerobium saccharolyticum]PTV93159.1 type III restriction/modification enzyme restriction subunit [Halanaerobium saccharolyticum]